MYCLSYAVGISPTLGIRGMIAVSDIQKGKVIERCPIILVPKSEQEHLLQTKIQNYYFDWTEKDCAVVLGYGSLVNHSFTPNAAYRWDYLHKNMVYFSLRNIRKAEEVTINYNGDPNDKTSLPVGWVSSKSY